MKIARYFQASLRATRAQWPTTGARPFRQEEPRAFALALPVASAAIARRSACGRSVGGGEDDVGGLDDCRHVRALLEAEFAGCLHGDGGDQALAVDVDLDVGDRGALGDALDGAGELVASAELHGGCSCRWSGTFPSSLRPGSCTGGRGAWP